MWGFGGGFGRLGGGIVAWVNGGILTSDRGDF